MAGGVGSRFWPISRNARPKQFLDILGVGRTFLQQTYDRFVRIIPPERIYVVTAQVYRNLVEEQLPGLDPGHILCEPFRRNTAPCIAYAMQRIRAVDPAATVVVAPSDHHITNEPLFLDTVGDALDYAAEHDRLFTLGIEPLRPETGYGYIQTNVKDFRNIGGNVAYSVKTFTEKPDAELAGIFIRSGEFLWNSGIFIWNIRTILSEMDRCLPEVSALFRQGEGVFGTSREEEFVRRVYEACPSISIDYGVMEKTDIAWVIKASFGWSDLGTWESLYLHSPKDANGNLVRCRDLMMDKISDSVIYSSEKDKLLAIKGLKDFMIINTDDVLMICPRDEVRFKNMLTDLAVHEKSKFQ